MKQFLEKYDPDEIAQLGNYIHALISSDATTPSKATKEYFEMALKNAITPVETKLDNHIEKEEADSNTIFGFIEEMKPILERFKNSQGFWSVLSNSGKTIVFLASVIVAGGTCIFFFYKIGKILIEHGF